MIGVTGATGFIGSHLMEKLGERGAVIDFRTESDEYLIRKIKNMGCDCLIHLASPLPSEGADQDVLASKIGELAQRVKGVAESSAIKHLISLSTIRVYPSTASPFSMESPVMPMDGYGRGKMVMEGLFAGSDVPTTTLRCSSVQGVGKDGTPRGVVGAFARQSQRDGVIRVMGDGGAMKDLIHVSDLCELLVELALRRDVKRSRTFAVGGGGRVKVIDLAERIQRVSGATIEHIKAAKYELSGYVDNSEIYDFVTWRPLLNVDEIVKESMNSVRGD